MRRSFLLLAISLIGCTYGPPEYHGRIANVAMAGEYRAAIVYLQQVLRPPTGMTGFPDGAGPKVEYEKFVVAMVDSSGRTRELARFDNRAMPGSGSIHLTWDTADPQHLYARFYGQLTTGLPQQFLTWTTRLNLDGKMVATYDTRGELKRRGREAGAKGFGSDRVVDGQGTLLVGATRDETKEVWRRDPDGQWTLLDWFDENASLVGEDLLYFQNHEQFARNWRTGALRKVYWFDFATKRGVVPNRSDPALKPPPIEPRYLGYPSSDGHAIEVSRDNVRVAVIRPDLTILDRR